MSAEEVDYRMLKELRAKEAAVMIRAGENPDKNLSALLAEVQRQIGQVMRGELVTKSGMED